MILHTSKIHLDSSSSFTIDKNDYFIILDFLLI